ncbi:MAG: helix-turn-helix domain-containing protein [Burkholderiales bacterium]
MTVNLTLDQWEKSSRKNRRELAEETLIVDVSEAIWDALEKERITKSDLAAMLGVSKARITKLLNGSQNMTLRTVADIADAIDWAVSIEIKKREREIRWSGGSAKVVSLASRTAGPGKAVEVEEIGGSWYSAREMEVA